MSRNDVGSLLTKIKALAQINQEIVKRLEDPKLVAITYHYLLKEERDKATGVMLHRVEEVERKQTAEGATRAWEESCLKSPKPSHTLLQIRDLFNDKLNYAPKTFKDLAALNAQMLDVADKYEMFGESPKAVQELLSFKQNFEVIQVLLGELEGTFKVTPSTLQHKKEQIRQVNEVLLQFKKSNPVPNDLNVVSNDLPVFQKWNVVNGVTNGMSFRSTQNGCWAYLEPILPMNGSYSIHLDIPPIIWFKVLLHQDCKDPNVGRVSTCEVSTYTENNFVGGEVIISVNKKKVSLTNNGKVLKSSNNISLVQDVLVKSDHLYLIVSPYHSTLTVTLKGIRNLL